MSGPIPPCQIVWELRVTELLGKQTALLTATTTWRGRTYSGQGATAQQALDGLLLSIGVEVRP